MQFETEEREQGHATIAVCGWVVQESIEQLRVACDSLHVDGKTVELDLSQVTLVDALGAAVLRDLCRQGTRIVEAPPFILEFIGGACRE